MSWDIKTVEKHREAILAAIFLMAIECLIFGFNLGKIGNYLDEWISFGKLHFSSQNLLDLISLFLADPRVIVRPLEALHYPVIYFFVHEKPLLYHVVNFAFELLASIFLFLFVRKVVGDARFSFAVAALYILWPSHDATHYSIVASSVNVAAMFFIWSLLVSSQGFQSGKQTFNSLSALLFLTSLLHYEFTLPLAVLYPILWLYFDSSTGEKPKRFFISMAPYALAGIAFVVYRAKVLPALNVGWNYQTTVDWRHFCQVFSAGIGQNFSPESWLFFYSLAFSDLGALDHRGMLLLAALLLALALAFFVLKSRDVSLKCLCFVLVLALIAIPFSYVIYGFSPDHMPQLQNGLNRVNMGSSIGMSLLVPALIGIVLRLLKWKVTGKIFIAANSIVILFFALVCLQYAVPWVTSWQTQRQVQALLQVHKQELLASDSLLLLDIARFVRWAPVYDGIWDFQNTCRIVLDNPEFKATVLTERLIAADSALEDRLGPTVLTALPYQKMLIFQASTGQWTSVNNKSDFDHFVAKNHIVVNGCK